MVAIRIFTKDILPRNPEQQLRAICLGRLDALDHFVVQPNAFKSVRIQIGNNSIKRHFPNPKLCFPLQTTTLVISLSLPQAAPLK